MFVNWGVGMALSFEAGGKLWALPLPCLRKVVHLPSTTALPNGPDFLHGFLNLAGDQVPILRLATLLNLPEQPDKLYTPVLLLKEHPLALLVCELRALLELSSDSLRPVPPDYVLNDAQEGAFLHQGREVHLLDPHRLLLEEEKLRLEHLRQDHEKRLSRLEARA